MSDLAQIENIIPAGLCSRTQFQAERSKVEALLREATRARVVGRASAKDRLQAERSLEQDVAQSLQRLIVRAKGIVSEEMLVRHQREIPVDEIPDYAVTHLLLELGEQEVQDRLG